MTDENRRNAIGQQLRQAELAYQEAQLLRDGGLFRGATNRLYYSLFHVLFALLLTEGIEPRRHRSLPHLLSGQFAALLGPAEIAFVAQMASNRDLADYAPAWEPTAEMVEDAFNRVDALVARIREHLTTGGWTPST